MIGESRMLDMNSKAFKNKTILKILDYYKDLWSLSYASGVAHWDMETYMPIEGAGARAQALGRLATIRQKMFLDKDFVSVIHKAFNQSGLTDEEKGVLRVLKHSLKFYEKIPAEFLEKFENLTNKATVVWREAKAKEDYRLFEPYLAKIFDANRLMADYLGYEDSPYDALLDQFEEGLKVSEVEPFFESIRQPLRDILSKSKTTKTHFLERKDYNKEELVKLNQKVLKLFLGTSSDRLRLDISAHPFTTSFSRYDTRITTWYHEKDFGRSLLATIHEFGHALYDLQCDDNLEMTPIQGGSSLVIHESQSRFWENFVGRSKPFVRKFIPDFKQVTGGELQVEDVYAYFNTVKPGLLRVEADEVTYHFHIMLRYEIEKGMIERRFKIKDLREIWNTKMKEYLGLVPKKESEGVLQDIHWSGGMVGYFPTYSLGTFLGAQWENEMNDKTGAMNYDQIKIWLRDHIHKFGSTYTLQELLKMNKMKFDPSVNLNYLREKYTK